MQTRKRAKSVMFGNKHTHIEKKEPTEHHAVKKEEVTENEKIATKATVVERRPVHEKPLIEEELSPSPPKVENEPEEVEETKSNEVEEDSLAAPAPEEPKDIKEALSDAVVEPSAQATSEESTLSKPVETPLEPTATPNQPIQQGESQELSSTLPPSAFTIQTDEQAPLANNPVSGTGGKKRFVIYFFVVAFISFILGLGAMAGASYFGIANLHLNKLTSGVHVPGLLGQKPTPTSMPPTVAPTQKPVDLTAYTIAVLNGSGIAGKAAEEKTILSTAGFKITSVGNADKSTYTQTEISATSSVDQAFLSKLETVLQKDYDVDTTVATSPTSSQTDVTVTLGSSNAQ
jgi:hypothetical protein